MSEYVGGRRKALLIGISYKHTQAFLPGCIPDVINLKQFLLENGYVDSPSTMLILKDDESNESKMPTKENILAACHWLVREAQAGDRLLFHYSGHGTQVEDKSGDEIDGMDEAIVPLDYQSKGLIIDDDLHSILVRDLRRGVRLTAIFDSCHSGSALDLPFVYQPDGAYKSAGIAKREFSGEVFRNFYKDPFNTLMNFPTMIAKNRTARLIDEKNMKELSCPADVIMISGCRDEQTSADAKLSEESSGVMSYALRFTLQNKPEPTLIELLNDMRDFLIEKKFPQIPQMSTSHEIDPSSKFYF